MERSIGPSRTGDHDMNQGIARTIPQG